jgi:hypothetical protein
MGEVSLQGQGLSYNNHGIRTCIPFERAEYQPSLQFHIHHMSVIKSKYYIKNHNTRDMFLTGWNQIGPSFMYTSSPIDYVKSSKNVILSYLIYYEVIIRKRNRRGNVEEEMHWRFEIPTCCKP